VERRKRKPRKDASKRFRFGPEKRPLLHTPEEEKAEKKRTFYEVDPRRAKKRALPGGGGKNVEPKKELRGPQCFGRESRHPAKKIEVREEISTVVGKGNIPQSRWESIDRIGREDEKTFPYGKNLSFFDLGGGERCPFPLRIEKKR